MNERDADELFDKAVERLKGWREGRGILRFVVENFQATPDPWQEQALLALASFDRRHQRVAMKACVGPGKTAVLAWYIWWFMSVLADGDNHPKGLATAINGDNLKQNLWAELSQWRLRSPFLMRAFKWTASAIFSAKDDLAPSWRVEARTWAKTASVEQLGQTFSGLHAKYVTAVVDESGNCPTPILRAAEQALSRCLFGKLAQAGNPTALEGYMLYDACTSMSDLWHVITVTGDPDDALAWVNAPRVRQENPEALAWSKTQIAQHGRDNAWVRTQVLGQFPPAALNALLGIEECEASAKLVLRPERYEWIQKRIGVDVARFGDDRTCFAFRQGPMIYKFKEMRNATTDRIAARAANFHMKWGEGESLLFVDATGGWGMGTIDQLNVAGIANQPVQYAAKAGSRQYANVRAEMWMRMADKIKTGGHRLPMDRALWAELSAVTYLFHNGQFLLEDKDQVKKRLGRSPDKADALAQTYMLEDMPKGATNRAGRARTHDDPQGRDTDARRAGRALTMGDVDE